VDLMSLIHEAGFRGQAANIMYGIVMAESGGNTRAHNTNARNGDNSYGLAQINMLGSMGPARLKEYGLSSPNDLFDPLTNLKVAYKMSGGGTHFGDWSTYNSGAYQQHMGQSGAQVTSSGSGYSADGSSGQPLTSKMTAADYSGIDSLGSLLNSVPELRTLVDQAVAGSWSSDKFQNAVEDSKWWKTHSQTARQAITQRANDPASFNQLLTNLESSVTNLSRQLGFPVSAASIKAIANTALLTGNDSNQAWLTQQLAHHHDYSHLGSTAGMTGQMAQTIQQLSQMGSDYGYKMTPAQLAQRAQNVLDGYTTIDTYRQNLISWAKSTFPSLSDQLDAGQTVKQLADPYVNSMSQLLEVDPGTLDVFTPAIRKAMQGYVDPSTKQRASTPLWQFEDQVRQDPRWALTQNARDTMSTALVKVGADFGFGPSA
jgi:hypothetical protein